MPQPITLLAYSFDELAPKIQEKLIDHQAKTLAQSESNAIARKIEKALMKALPPITGWVSCGDWPAIQITWRTSSDVLRKALSLSPDASTQEIAFLVRGSIHDISVRHYLSQKNEHFQAANQGTFLIAEQIEKVLSKNSLDMNSLKKQARESFGGKYLPDGTPIDENEAMRTIATAEERLRDLALRVEALEDRQCSRCC